MHAGSHRATHVWFRHASIARSHVLCRWHSGWASGAGHMRRMSRRRIGLAVVDFGHSANASTTQSRILIAVPPAVNGSLDQASFPA
jgi:hypothetical protein